MLKIKVVFGENIRLFKFDETKLGEAFDALTTFVRKNFKVENFILRYKDDEEDMITIASVEDFQDALETSELGKTVKVFVFEVIEENRSQGNVNNNVEMKSEQLNDVRINKDYIYENENENENGNNESFIFKLVNNVNFRGEFVSFLQDIILKIREGDQLEIAVTKSLSSHQELANNNDIRKVVSMLPFLSVQAAFLIPLLSTLDPNEIPSLIESVVTGFETGNDANLPPLIQMFRMHLSGMMNPQQNGPPHPHPQFPPSHPHPHSFDGWDGWDGWNGWHGWHGFGGRGGNWRGRRHNHNHNHNHNHHHHRHHYRGKGRGHHHNHHGFGRRGGRRGGFGGFGRGFCRGFGRRGGGRGGYHGFNHHNWHPYSHYSQQPNNDQFHVALVNDAVTLCDKAPVYQNQTVIKTWRLKNTGEKDWPEGTQLVFTGRRDNPLVKNVRRFTIPNVRSGQEADCSVALEIPPIVGNHSCKWRLHTPEGYAFGPPLKARLIILNEEKRSNDINDTEKLNNEFEILDITGEDVNMDNSPSAPLLGSNHQVFEQQMQTLQMMGFTDDELNKFLLEEHEGKIDVVLKILTEFKK